MLKRKAITSLSAILVCLLLSLLLVFEKDAAGAAREALSLSVSSVIPSLFPYMVVSSVIISLDLLQPVYSLISTEKLFGLPRVSAQVILCGIVCGFPIGALGAKRLYENGSITKAQAAKLWAISSQTSPSFLIGAVGGWWHSPGFGLFLYLCQIFFAFVAGFILSRVQNEGEELSVDIPPEKCTFMEALCRGISESSLSCLAITGYIVFFRVIAVMASAVLPPLAPIFMTVFEFSTGAFFGSTTGGIPGAAITGFAVGFSGLAVFMQCVNFTEKHGIPSGRYVTVKLCEGVFLGAAAAIFSKIIPLSPSASVFSPLLTTGLPLLICKLGILFAVFFLSTYARRRN
ncbi:MAG: hypothetical protein E7627_07230 [Ruminococcaceae bacterium]|nr:hypothetical protein [Oscillospiraceae bacterium]